jgi:hypothetical protein
VKYPIPDPALDDRLAWVGTAGSGKTYNAGSGVERLLARKARAVIADPLGVWWGLRLRPDGKSESPYSVVIFGGPHGDIAINEHAGALIGETVAAMAESCIIDLSQIGTKAGERRFMLAFLTALYRKATGEPLHLIVDEADMFAPQVIRDRDQEPAKLLGMMETIVRRGRVKGFIPWLITQRPAVLNKDVLSQADGIISFKLTASQDRDAIGGWIDGQADKQEGRAILASLPTMQRGQGVVWVPGRGILETASFPEKQTFDSSRTPVRGETKRTAELKPLDLGKLKERLSTIEAESQASDPKKLRAEIATLKAELERAKKAQPAQPSAEGLHAAETRGFRLGFDEAAKQAKHSFEVWKTLSIKTVASFSTSFGSNLGKEVLEFQFPEWKSVPLAAPTRAAHPAPRMPAARPPVPQAKPSPQAAGDGTLTNPQLTLLRSLAWWRAMGHDNPSRPQIAAIAGWKVTAGHLKNVIGSLNTAGLTVSKDGHVALSDAGAAAAPEPDMGLTLIDGLRGVLSNPQRQIFECLLESRRTLSRADIAERVGWDANAGHLKNVIGSMRTIEIIDYPSGGMVELQDWVLG